MISYRQFFDKLTSEQVQALAALQQKAIGLSADIAKFMDNTEDLLTEKEGQFVFDQDMEDAYSFADTTSMIIGRYLSKSDNPINAKI